ncbi:Organic radical activating enzyme [Methanonatronarchaeum thermophilum]|uniref:7-carboxy-7-deazaguanine synthase n=1 Tax=Methanonatronarchaeum thermophilum TaxID=1927129 RepID=A0A1Y3GH08_9EURY|nr:7-carboxy-7-deazaguanine synthase QueE [Methanonatronarchaeum thermophilum]OUJ18656.1 Organic radical activating enzyme [Methanonatronarchaeum thermophilum]
MKVRVNNIFESIQGEGRYIGTPSLFIRTSGCNLTCSWCDTNIKIKKELTVEELTQVIKDSTKNTVVWTGGEPTLQNKPISEVIDKIDRNNHLETNATNIENSFLEKFDYIAFSPKEKVDAEKIHGSKLDTEYDVKVVTDLNEVGTNLIEYASILMPLTTGNQERDMKCKKRVWKYCIEKDIQYSPRAHIDVWRDREEKELKKH